MRPRLVPYVYAAPAALLMLGGLAVPLMSAADISLHEWRLGDTRAQAVWRGLSLYAEALSDPAVLASMSTTIVYAIVVVSIELLLGVALALLLESKIRGAAALRTLFILPMMIAPICVGLIWRYLFDTSYGPINAVFGAFGLQPTWLADPSLAFLAICVTDIWQWTPFVMLMVLAGLQGLDGSVMEAAQMDGARSWRLVWNVKLPMLRPILMITLLMRLIDALRGLEVIYVMTYGGPGLSTELFSLHITKTAFVSQRLGYAAAMSVLLLLVMVGLSASLLLLSNPMRRVAK